MEPSFMGSTYENRLTMDSIIMRTAFFCIYGWYEAYLEFLMEFFRPKSFGAHPFSLLLFMISYGIFYHRSLQLKWLSTLTILQ